MKYLDLRYCIKEFCSSVFFQSSKDLVCLVQFEHVNVYSGIGWKKKFKAPSDHCFALKVRFGTQRTLCFEGRVRKGFVSRPDTSRRQ